jgi:RNA polymerase sigma-70 factor (ECF subfamily)
LSESAENRVLGFFLAAETREAIENLPETFLFPMLLIDAEGFSCLEVAEKLNIPIDTVMSRLHRGRTTKQKALCDFVSEHRLITEKNKADD